jgi:hypothetical protein
MLYSVSPAECGHLISAEDGQGKRLDLGSYRMDANRETRRLQANFVLI